MHGFVIKNTHEGAHSLSTIRVKTVQAARDQCGNMSSCKHFSCEYDSWEAHWNCNLLDDFDYVCKMEEAGEVVSGSVVTSTTTTTTSTEATAPTSTSLPDLTAQTVKRGHHPVTSHQESNSLAIAIGASVTIFVLFIVACVLWKFSALKRVLKSFIYP